VNWSSVLTSMLPEHALLAGIVLLVVLDVARSGARSTFLVSVLALAAATAAAAWLASTGYAGAPFPEHFSVSPTSSASKLIVLALALPVLLVSRDDFSEPTFHILLLSSLYGVCLLVSADSFLTLFLGLEIMSLPVYALVLLAFQRTASAEAALKYLVLGGTATATLLMGVALLYGQSGSLAVSAFADALTTRATLSTVGIVLIIVAFFLKAAIVPFHAWAPDAYEGATVPVTAYMAAIIKAGVLLAVVRLFGAAQMVPPMTDLIAVLPLLSIIWGNLAAMRQASFRRMIAYSSIAHAGYLFYALLGEASGRFQAVAFYLLTYGVMNVLAFSALPADRDDAARDRLDNLKGLFSRKPVAAVLIALSMLSLAGIPPLPGFIAKFLIFRNVIAAGFTLYGVLGLLASYLGIYFYLRVVQYLFMSPQEATRADGGSSRLAWTASFICLVTAILIGVFPGWVIDRL